MTRRLFALCILAACQLTSAKPYVFEDTIETLRGDALDNALVGIPAQRGANVQSVIQGLGWHATSARRSGPDEEDLRAHRAASTTDRFLDVDVEIPPGIEPPCGLSPDLRSHLTSVKNVRGRWSGDSPLGTYLLTGHCE